MQHLLSQGQDVSLDAFFLYKFSQIYSFMAELFLTGFFWGKRYEQINGMLIFSHLPDNKPTFRVRRL